MADKSLKSSYRGIAAEEAEMARYRARLASALSRPRPRRAWLLLPATAAAAVLLFLLPGRVDEGLSQLNLAQLQQLSTVASDTLLDKARNLATDGERPDRWNAVMLLCLHESPDLAVQYAAQGVQEDPRAEFRSFYLEYLLDHADERRYNTALIEELIDREPDVLCLRLFRQLLSVAHRHEGRPTE